MILELVDLNARYWILTCAFKLSTRAFKLSTSNSICFTISLLLSSSVFIVEFEHLNGGWEF